MLRVSRFFAWVSSVEHSCLKNWRSSSTAFLPRRLCWLAKWMLSKNFSEKIMEVYLEFDLKGVFIGLYLLRCLFWSLIG